MGLRVDIGIIGGGIHGAGVAQAAAAAGYSVCLLEQTGVASGTSSRSSKLVHGGLRYLETLQLSLVRKSLAERSLLVRNAPDLVTLVPFYIPVYPQSQRRSWKIWSGLMLYSLLGGLGRDVRFKKMDSFYLAEKDGLRSADRQGLYQYWDAQTDDEALTLAVIKSAQSLGARLHCPAKAGEIRYQQGEYHVQVDEPKQTWTLTCKALVNAAGPWVNKILAQVTPTSTSLDVDLVQGAHIIVDDAAPTGVYYVESPEDARAVFVMPWQGKTMIGTTESLFAGDDPALVQPSQAEVEYLQRIYQHYFPQRHGKIIDSFAGLRVLPKQQGSFFSRPRDTALHADPALPGLVTLYGGKLTGFRAVAEEVIQKLHAILGNKTRKADTRKIELHL